MKGFRLFRDCGSGANDKSSKRKFRSKDTQEGNVIAVFLDPVTNNPMWQAMLSYTMGDVRYTCECVAAVFDHPNSAVCCTSASGDYLRHNCIRVSEKVARQIHPAMFTYLDTQNAIENEVEV